MNNTNCTWHTTHCAIRKFSLFCTVFTNMTWDPARKSIPVLIARHPDPGLWKAKTRTSHSQDPGQNNRVTRNVPSRNPVSETWCLHQEWNGLSVNALVLLCSDACLGQSDIWSLWRTVPRKSLVLRCWDFTRTQAISEHYTDTIGNPIIS